METLREETSLFEVFHPLVARWKWIVAGVLAGLMVAAAVTVVSKKQYQTTVLLQIGAVLDKQIEDSNTVVEIINSDSFCQTVATKLKLNSSSRQLAKVIRAETSPNRISPLVTVTVLSDSPEGAVALADAVFSVMDARHKPLFDEKMAYYIEYGKMLQEKVKTIDAELSNLKTQLDAMGPKGDLSAKLVLENKIGEREDLAITYKKDLREVLAYSALIHSHSTVMVSPPVLPTRPVKPNLKLNLIIAFLVSIFAMVSVILIMDQYRKASLRL